MKPKCIHCGYGRINHGQITARCRMPLGLGGNFLYADHTIVFTEETSIEGIMEEIDNTLDKIKNKIETKNICQ